MKKSILFLLVFMAAALLSFGQKVSDATMGTYNNTYIKAGIDGGIRANSHNTFNKYIIASKAHKDSLDNVRIINDTTLEVTYKGVKDTMRFAAANYWYLSEDTVRTIYPVKLDSSFLMKYNDWYLGLMIEGPYDNNMDTTFLMGKSGTGGTGYLMFGNQDADSSLSFLTYIQFGDTATRISQEYDYVLIESAGSPSTLSRIKLQKDSVVINGQIFIPDIEASGVKYSGNVAGIGLDDRLFPKSIVDLYNEMEDTIALIPTTRATWVRDTTNGYLYPAKLTDKIGIGTEMPATPLDIKAPTDSVNNEIITLRNTAYVGGISADSRYNYSFGYNVLSENTDGLENIGIGYKALEKNTTGDQNIAIGYLAMSLGRFGIGNTAVGVEALKSLDTNSSTNTAFGIAALKNMTQGACNTAVGAGALQAQTVALDNTAVGSNAGISITTGAENTAVGTFSLSLGTTGKGNTAYGFHALDSIASGNYNTGIGHYAGWRYKNISYTISLGYLAAYNQTNSADNSQPNIAIGKQALYGGVDSTGTGYDNINIGTGSGYKSTHGFHNIGIGYNSLYSSIFGQYNVGIGYRALYTNTTGTANVAIGLDALYTNATGADNTAVGNAALNKNTASFNVGIGAFSAKQNTSGIRNTALGNSALEKNTTYSDNTAIGTYALRYHIAAENTAVGSQALNGSSGNSTGGQNTAVGYGALYSNRAGDHNTAIGHSAGLSNQNGHYNVFIGNSAGYSETGSYKFYLAADSTSSANGMATGSKLLMYGDMSNADKAHHTLNIFAKVAIGSAAAPSNALDVTGAVNITTSCTVGTFIKLTPTADPPGSPSAGMIYSDTDGHIYHYDGSNWDQLDN